MIKELDSLHWGVVRSSFFDRALLGIRSPSRAMFPSPPNRAPAPTSSHSNHGTSNSPTPKPPLTRGDRENLERFTLATSLAASTQLEYGPTHPTYIATLVAGRTCLFFENWTRVTKDPWVLTTIRGYQIPLEYWPKEHWSTTTVSEEQQSVLLEEVTKLREKEAVLPVQQTEAHIVSPVFVVPKHGGGWRLIINLRYLNSYMVPPHFKMEGLFMLPSMVSHGWLMAKLDLKDAYLTIPIAQESWKLLTFQAGPPHQLMQFRCLPFGLCTAPFAFSKATKPITQFLRQLGIHLIGASPTLTRHLLR